MNNYLHYSGIFQGVYGTDNPWLSPNIALFGINSYLVLVLVGKFIMKFKSKFELRRLLVYHNCFLFVFSIFELVLGITTIVQNLTNYPFNDVYCATKYSKNGPLIYSGITWISAYLFYLSKFYEFFDTLFIILRKNNLIFLHVYHHLIVIPLSLAYLNQGIAFLINGVVSNSLIHSLMYWSYYKTIIGEPPSWKKYLTAAQMVQFVWGMITFLPWPFVCGYNWKSINGPMFVWWFNHAVLVSFFFLFMNFYTKRYNIKKKNN